MLREIEKEEMLNAIANGKQVYMLRNLPDPQSGKQQVGHVKNISAEIQAIIGREQSRFLLDSDEEPERSTESAKETMTAAPEAPEKARPVEIPKENQKRKPGRPKKIDIDNGKAVALWNAGWSYDDIADDLKTSTETVMKTIKKMKEEDETL